MEPNLDLTLAQRADVILQLLKLRPMTCNEVAEHLRLVYPTIYNTLKVMEHEKAVIRQSWAELSAEERIMAGSRRATRPSHTFWRLAVEPDPVEVARQEEALAHELLTLSRKLEAKKRGQRVTQIFAELRSFQW